MKKFILGAFATLMISGSALASGTTSTNETISTSVDNNVKSLNTITVRDLDANIKFDEVAMRRVCIITIKTYKGGELVSTQIIPIDVSDDLETAQTQCQALKVAFTLALN